MAMKFLFDTTFVADWAEDVVTGRPVMGFAKPLRPARAAAEDMLADLMKFLREVSLTIPGNLSISILPAAYCGHNSQGFVNERCQFRRPFDELGQFTQKIQADFDLRILVQGSLPSLSLVMDQHQASDERKIPTTRFDAMPKTRVSLLAFVGKTILQYP
jgi:hypothetical protein